MHSLFIIVEEYFVEIVRKTLVSLDIWEVQAACLVTVTGLQCLLFLYITLIIAGILIVIALLALNMTVAGGLINGYILYADIVAVGKAVFFFVLFCFVFLYPARMRRGKVIGLSICRRHHENRQISTSRNLNDSKVQRICRSWRKTGSRMLKIEWYGLQASQTVYFSWPS